MKEASGDVAFLMGWTVSSAASECAVPLQAETFDAARHYPAGPKWISLKTTAAAADHELPAAHGLLLWGGSVICM